MKVSDKEKTTFICHRGKFQYKRMPFGIKNAPVVFQGIVDEVLKDCRDCSRSFLGVISYYKMFVSGIANSTALLTPFRNKAAPARVRWTREMEVSFSELINSLYKMSVLNVPSPDDSFVLCVDASVLGISGVLCILRNEEEVPVAFYSRQTKNTERSYSATELVALALLCTIEHFSLYLFGKHFIIYTDHKALLSLMNSVHLNRRLHMISLKLQSWNFEIRHRPGKLNCVADLMSRSEVPANV